MKGLNLPPAALQLNQIFGFVDHFLYKDTARWTTTATDSGTAAVGDAVGGIMTLTASDGTVADNDEIYLLTVSEVLLIAAGKPISIAALMKFTEAATNAANIFFGCMNAIGADSIVDNGAGLKTNFSGACFYKVDSATTLNWRVIYSDGTTQTAAELSATNSLNKTAMVAGSSAYQLLEIDIVPKTSTLVDIIFKINGSTVYKMLDKTYASATEMQVGFGVKNGSAVNQTLLIDAVAVHQKG